MGAKLVQGGASPKPFRAAGFTLIELLVIISLMMVLLVLAAPALLKVLRRQKIEGVAQSTAMMLRLARLEAIKTSSQAFVSADLAAGKVTACNDMNRDLLCDTDRPLLGVVTLPAGVELSPVSGFSSPPTPAAAIFRSDGTVLDTGAFRFRNERGDRLEAAVLSRNGVNIRVRKEQAGAWLDRGQGWTWN
jgi:Tfp pilus assembly protein FimT